MHRFMKKVIATGIAAMCFATAAVPAHAMDPILPFRDVKGGMTGTAYTVVDSSGEIRSFDVDIVGNMDNGKGSSRMIMARARGPVIEQAGGILQGMSGSPILQNGRLVGAVTHVLVNDPTRGYGIFAQTMLEQAQQAAKTDHAA